ncbi:hypothetical protein BDV95DRAFT_599633 [Massariosphaeria phaeospora]|uniref:Uncharacterized protein n=1 Tax=Massariosphaeria phaeospora TaxID=100035 RepID=A0A7C8I5I9_9PLEO|nr:hypothetical protein BDV95DRAFT_599633 [Massariosphaeria phaeospora]
MGLPHGYSSTPGSPSLLIITFFVALLWILFIAELSLGKRDSDTYDRYWAQYPNRLSGGKSPSPPYPDWRWSSSGATHFAILAFALLLEVLHLPIHHFLIYKQKMRPVAALCTSLFMFAIWLANAIICQIVIIGQENGYADELSTDELAMAGTVLRYLVVILYMFYAAYSAVAVHRRRMESKNPNAMRELGERRGVGQEQNVEVM